MNEIDFGQRDAFFARVSACLQAASGLQAELVGADALERAVVARLAALGAAAGRRDDAGAAGATRATGAVKADGPAPVPLAPDAYIVLLEQDAAERQWLIEQAVVPETWFFRHRQAFDFIAGLASKRWRSGATPLRLASIPCSTGEEPYSIAMALLDAGLPPESFAVDAVDISEVALARARIGRYRPNAFRGSDVRFRDRYFTQIDDEWTISPEARARVAFRRANVVEEHMALQPGAYDFIFCRNLLIYFDRETQRAVVDRLRRALRHDGHLLVGPAEAILVSRAGMHAAQAPLAFAFHSAGGSAAAGNAAGMRDVRGVRDVGDVHNVRGGLASRAPGAVRPPLAGVNAVRPLPAALVASKGLSPRSPSSPAVTTLSTAIASARLGTRAGPRLPVVNAAAGRLPFGAGAVAPVGGGADAQAAAVAVRQRLAPAPTLNEAERLANEGRFDDALVTCATLVAAQPTADVYCLMGTIADATGRPDAAREHYRRAVYLDATHSGALMQLAEHVRLDGDHAMAERLLDRARRARPDLF